MKDKNILKLNRGVIKDSKIIGEYHDVLIDEDKEVCIAELSEESIIKLRNFFNNLSK